MLNPAIEKVNKVILDKGMETPVKILAVVGAYTIGRYTFKGLRKISRMVSSELKEANR